MDLSLQLVKALLSMMLMSLTGYIAVRTGIMSVRDSKPLSTLTIYILIPCLLVKGFQTDISPERLQGFLVCAVFAAIAHFVWILLFRVLRGPFHLTEIDQATMIYTNCGNLILPLISLTIGEEYIIYAVAYQLAFNTLLWSHGQSLMSGRRHIDIRRMLLHPNTIALAIGFAFMLARIRIPEFLMTVVGGFSSMTGPTSMFVIGMVIAGTSLKDIFGCRRAYAIAAGRLIFCPLVMIALLFFSGFLRRRPEFIPVLQVTMLAVAAPPSSTIAQMAVVYDREPVLASTYNVMGILMCIVTMPLILLIYQAIF